MSTFPAISSVPFGSPVIEELQFKTLISTFDVLGQEQRKQKNLYPKRLITLRYNYISKTEAQILYSYYIDRAGAFSAFKFFYPQPRGVNFTYVHEYVGTGDGSSTVFNLPSKSAGSYTLYVADSSQSDPSDYSFGVGAGPDGEDKVTFVAAPSAGQRITFSFAGILKVVCRFAEDRLSFENFYDRLVNTGVKLQGLLNSDA